MKKSVLSFAAALLRDGWSGDVRVTIRDGRIAALEAGVAARPGDERHDIALPGMANLHSHTFQRAMAGFAETRGTGPDSFWSWREAMYRVALAMEPEDVLAVARQACVEMLEAGFTRLGEFHYLHHAPDGTPYADPAELAGRVAAAAAETGISLTLLPVFYAHSDFGGAPPAAGQRRFVSDLDGFGRLLEGCRAACDGLDGAVVGIAPHSLRAVTPQELAALLRLVPDGPVHVHVAEQRKEVADCLAWSGARPVAWLLDNASVDERWCLVHATHATAEEIAAMAHRGAVAGLCPVTEADLGDGTFAAAAFRAAGGRFGIGTDSNVRVSVAGELRQLEYSQRLASEERNVLADPRGSTGGTLYRAAVAGGSAALGVPGSGLEVGAWADIVSLDAAHVSLAGRSTDRLLDGFVFAGGEAAIDCVWARGVKRVEGGRHVGRDAVAEAFARAMRRLWA